MAVPDVVGLAPGAAVRVLRGAGLRPRRTSDVHQDCAGSAGVTVQRPTAGTEGRPGARVTVTALDRSTTCDVPADLRAVGIAFVDFARGDGPPPELAGTVPFLLGNEPRAEITPATADRRRSWATCPPRTAGYAGATCPVSALVPERTNRLNGYPDDLTTQIRPNACEPSSRSRPAHLDDLRVVVVTALPEVTSCAYGARVELYVDHEDRIAAINVAVSEP